ncbi:MAG: hypothetical protein KF810_22970 [Rhizobiaceae bacterium]|nr:hypothetical protein [Rhizobiaceae bacterium]
MRLVTLRFFVSVALLIALSGCGTPPKQYTFERTKTYSATKDEIWTRLISYFTSNNIQIKTIEKDSGVIYAERSMVDASIADCGQGGLAADVVRTGGLNVFVQSLEPNKTQVSVNSDYKITRVFDGQPMVTACNSTGLIEGQILKHLGT